MRRSALRAQQITLAAAIFDKGGRILVDPDGYIPSTVVTDSFLEKVSLDAPQCAESMLTEVEFERRFQHGSLALPLDVSSIEELGHDSESRGGHETTRITAAPFPYP